MFLTLKIGFELNETSGILKTVSSMHRLRCCIFSLSGKIFGIPSLNYPFEAQIHHSEHRVEKLEYKNISFISGSKRIIMISSKAQL